MLNNAAQSCRLFGYKPENESNFSFCHYKYFSANGTDFLQLWLSAGPPRENIYVCVCVYVCVCGIRVCHLQMQR